MRVTGLFRSVLAIVLVAGLAVTFSAVVLADSPNWSDSKRDRMNTNRNSDAGVGNGGEVRITEQSSDNWAPAVSGEDGLYDSDPGNSSGRNRAADNDDSPRSPRGGGTGIQIYPEY